jgi:hypothetical protein
VMAHLQFFVEFATRGEVLGLGLGTSPEAWSAVLGEASTVASYYEGHLVHEYGFIAPNFSPGSEPGEMRCERIFIELKKLAWDGQWIPEPIGRRYGLFPKRVSMDDVADQLAHLDVPVYRLPRLTATDLDQFWVEPGRALFAVISPAQEGEVPQLQLGDIYSMSCAVGTNVRPEQLTGYR